MGVASRYLHSDIDTLERVQIIGMVLLFGLMIYANFNDVIRFLF